MRISQIFLLVAFACTTSAQISLPNIFDRIRDRLVALARDALNQEVINFLESQRGSFGSGWPALGIPPIDPLFIEDIHANLDEIGTLSAIDFRLMNATFRGLQQFEIKNFDLRIIKPSLNFEFFFQQLQIDGQHSTQASLAGIPVNGNGSIVMAFNEVRVKGSVVINTLEGGFLNIDDMVLNLTVGSVAATLRGFGFFLDPTISLAISIALPPLINEGQDRINDLVSEQILPPLNEILNQYLFFDLLVAIINAVLNPNVNEHINSPDKISLEVVQEIFQV